MSQERHALAQRRLGLDVVAHRGTSECGSNLRWMLKVGIHNEDPGTPRVPRPVDHRATQPTLAGGLRAVDQTDRYLAGAGMARQRRRGVIVAVVDHDDLRRQRSYRGVEALPVPASNDHTPISSSGIRVTSKRCASWRSASQRRVALTDASPSVAEPDSVNLAAGPAQSAVSRLLLVTVHLPVSYWSTWCLQSLSAPLLTCRRASNEERSGTRQPARSYSWRHSSTKAL